MSRAEIVKWPEGEVEQKRLIDRAVALIRGGEVVAFPTDTVYGIGAFTWDGDAVQRLYAIKERPAHKAIALLLSGPDQMAAVTEERSPSLEILAARYWPGGLTIVVPWKKDILIAGQQPLPTVGIRVPNHPVAISLIAAVGTPLATTSANLSGAPSTVSAEEVDSQIGDRIALIIDGGRCPGGRDSTVIDLTTTPPTIRRDGAVPTEELRALLGAVQK